MDAVQYGSMGTLCYHFNKLVSHDFSDVKRCKGVGSVCWACAYWLVGSVAPMYDFVNVPCL